MCDTIVALPRSTSEHITLFGKNSDRERNEAQVAEYFPRAEYGKNAQLSCTYIAVPQVRRTHAVLLCRPYWMWGAEMGANEHGVAIGNEAVHSHTPPQEEKALLGMDLLRLALERAATAAEALEVMVTLLEQYGQGGNCGHLAPFYYHNSFMIADPRDAFVLETVRRDWLVERVSGTRSISNAYSIGSDVDRMSAGLFSHLPATENYDERNRDYAEGLTDCERDAVIQGRARCSRSASLLRAREGQLTPAVMMSILRDHGPDAEQTQSGWHPQHALARTVCMHAGDDEHRGQTVGSLVSELGSADAVHWVTGTAAPCLSVFKPVFMNALLPECGARATDHFDSSALWWRHELLHRRAVLGDFSGILDDIRHERDALEVGFRARVTAVRNGGSSAERSQVVAECWRDAIEAEDRWFARMQATSQQNETRYRAAWVQLNQLADIDVDWES